MTYASLLSKNITGNSDLHFKTRISDVSQQQGKLKWDWAGQFPASLTRVVGKIYYRMDPHSQETTTTSGALHRHLEGEEGPLPSINNNNRRTLGHNLTMLRHDECEYRVSGKH